MLLGIVWCAALAIKVNAFFILLTQFLWVILFLRHGYLASRNVMIGVIGVPLFILMWPWLYHNTTERLSDGTPEKICQRIREDFKKAGSTGELVSTTAGSLAARTKLCRMRWMMQCVSDDCRYDQSRLRNQHGR